MTKLQEKQLLKKLIRKCRLCIGFSLGLIFCLNLIKMFFSNRASNWGHNLEAIKQQTQTIKLENLNLKGQLAQQTGGLNQLAQQAQEKGFTDKPVIKYFKYSVSVAQKLP